MPLGCQPIHDYMPCVFSLSLLLISSTSLRFTLLLFFFLCSFSVHIRYSNISYLSLLWFLCLVWSTLLCSVLFFGRWWAKTATSLSRFDSIPTQYAYIHIRRRKEITVTQLHTTSTTSSITSSHSRLNVASSAPTVATG